MRQKFKNLVKCLIYHPGRCRNYSSKRESLMFQKIIARGEKSRRKKSLIPEASCLNQYAHQTLCSRESRRNTVLNKIFMDHISDLMTSGLYADEIYDCGIHVTQAKVTVNYHLLYVYWIHTKDLDEPRVNDLLKKVAVYLRKELTSARIMGQVPEVRFVMDKDFIKIKHAEELIDQLKDLKNEGVTDQTIVEQEQEQENVSNQLDSQLPPMRYNVFGLEYLQIMNNIQNEMRKCVVKPHEEVLVTLKDNKKKEIQEFEKKELARVIFSKRYEMKKYNRLIRKELEPALDEDSFNDETYESHEDYEDWPAENEEIEYDWSRDPQEDQDDVGGPCQEARRENLDEDEEGRKEEEDRKFTVDTTKGERLGNG